MKKIKVLHIVGQLDVGGVSKVIHNYYMGMNHNKVQFDFITHNKKEGLLEIEFKKMGSHFFNIPSRRENYKEYKKNMHEILEKNGYDIVHVHLNHSSFLPLYLAKRAGVKIRICHSHTSITNPALPDMIRKLIFSPLNRLFANCYFACGQDAALWQYGKKMYEKRMVRIIPNGIDINTYKFDLEKRIKIREELNVGDKFLIGHVGRFSVEKNHEFLINFFHELKLRNSNVRLLLIGEGPLYDKIKNLVDRMKLLDDVIFLGRKANVNEYLNALDLFILPSLYEGFPLTLVEAQANGLNCIVSDSITKEAIISNKVLSLPLNESWADKIENAVRLNDSNRSYDDKLLKFDVGNLSLELEEFYINSVRKVDCDDD